MRGDRVHRRGREGRDEERAAATQNYGRGEKRHPIRAADPGKRKQEESRAGEQRADDERNLGTDAHGEATGPT